jgi:hypothetical protein
MVAGMPINENECRADESASCTRKNEQLKYTKKWGKSQMHEEIEFGIKREPLYVRQRKVMEELENGKQQCSNHATGDSNQLRLRECEGIS